MATLDDALTGASKLLDQLSKQQLLGKVDASVVRQPDEQLDRWIAELTRRIAELTQRKADAAAAYDIAIRQDQEELAKLKAQATHAATPPPGTPPTASNATAPPAGADEPPKAKTGAKPKRKKKPE